MPSYFVEAEYVPDIVFGMVQTFGMGDKSELLATVRQSQGKSGPLAVEVVSDVAAPLVLHWGVRKSGRGDWSKPSEKLWPSGSTKATDTAIDSPFQVLGCLACTTCSQHPTAYQANPCAGPGKG